MSKPRVRKKSLPYSDSKLTPEQSMAAITKLIESLGCKDYDWMTLGGQKTLRFALKVKVRGVEKFLAYKLKPPPLTKTVTSYNPRLYKNEKIVVSDDITAFRVLFWYTKNKIIAVQTGLFSFEEEFMPHMIIALPDGTEQTLQERLQDEILGLAGPLGFRMLPAPAELEKKGTDLKIVSGEFKENGSKS
jgi:hypothetical protein